MRTWSRTVQSYLYIAKWGRTMGIRSSSPSTAVRVSVVRSGGGGALATGGGPDGEPPDDVDTLSAGSLKAATANDCGAKYILHEEWLADVCGVSRRRCVLVHHSLSSSLNKLLVLST